MNRSGKIPTWLTALITVAISALGIYLLVRLAPSLLTNLEPKTNIQQPQEAPDFILEDTAGGKVKLSDFRGQPVILSFWTSWNEASVEELKTLDSYGTVQGGGLAIFAVNSLEDKNTVQEIKNRYNLNLKMLLDADGSVGEAYKIGVLPKTVFVDKGGLIVSEVDGPLSLSGIKGELAGMH